MSILSKATITQGMNLYRQVSSRENTAARLSLTLIFAQGMNPYVFVVALLHRSQKIKEKLENSKTAKLLLFLSTILGTSMVIGDGVLTPCISGIAVVAVMLITTSLITLIMLVIWKTKIWLAFSFFAVFISIELVYFSSFLYKFTQGGYLPLAFSILLMIMMGVWHYAQQQRYMFELNNKVSSVYVRDLAKNDDVKRIPGIGLLYSELVQGVPPIFPHFISNIPSIHSVVVFVSIKSIPISKVAVEERFLFRQVEPREYRLFKCVVRYGYKDPIEEPNEFERQLVENLKEFIRHEHFMLEQSVVRIEEQQIESRVSNVSSNSNIESFHNVSDLSNRIVGPVDMEVEEEMEFVERAKEEGVYYLMGEAEVVARQDSSLMNKFVINYAYSFLRKNFREGEKVLSIPRTRLLRILKLG
ncbi:Potassium transporter 5 [Castilleja foliolosa]|uniref:Potassium transporter 5 n=1 Tax=Castilleja foliolosa TaxID=1961234 RepID=A0ABD3D5D3_9LAMI